MIDPKSVEYWDRCLYEASGFFSGDRSLEAVNSTPDHLRAYAQKAHDRRSPSPYGDVYFTELDKILTQTPPLRVLDFGCGVGIDSWYIASRGAEVVACDIVPMNVLVARRLLEPDMGRVVLLGSYEQLGQLGTFDLVYSHGCLHHVQNAGEVTPLLAQCVKPGGWALVMVYTKMLDSHLEGPFTRGYSIEELAQLFSPWLECHATRVFMNSCFMWGLFRRTS